MGGLLNGCDAAGQGDFVVPENTWDCDRGSDPPYALSPEVGAADQKKHGLEEFDKRNVATLEKGEGRRYQGQILVQSTGER